MALDITGLQVIYEDNHLIAVNKPARMLVHGDSSGDTPLVDYVKQYIKMRYGKPGDVFLGVVHRLDRPVSGTIVFARTSKALSRMPKLFANREIKKTYWAISKKRPQPLEGHLKHYLIKDNAKNMAKALDKPSRRNPDAKLAEIKMEKSNVNIKVIEGENMPHIWPFLPVMKEAKTSLNQMIHLIKT